MQKFVAALVTAGMLGGCAMALPAPMTPTPTKIAAQAAALAATNLDVTTYFETGVDLNFQNCHAWFDALATRQNEYSTSSGLTAVGGAGATGLLALTGSGPGPLAAAGLATGIVSGTLNALSNSTGIPYPVESGALVEQAQDTFLANLAPPATLAEADIDLDRMASYCSLRGAESLAAQAVASAQTVVAGPLPTAATFNALAVPQPRGFVPPPRVIVR